MYPTKISYIISLIVASIIILACGSDALSRPIPGNPRLKADKKIERRIFPDAYSALDDLPDTSQIYDAEFQRTINHSRRKYFQALTLIQDGDTANAAHYFESAINELNLLFSYPDAEYNESFIELTQFIIEDYEHFVQNIKYLDETSSLFRMKSLMYQEIEDIDPDDYEGIKAITPSDEHYTVKPGLVECPDTLVIPMPENDLVERNIKFLSQHPRGRNYLNRWLSRSSKWFPMMIQIAKEEGVPQEIIYLSMIESALLPDAVSSANAVGLWQFMRSTGEMYGLNKNGSAWIDERRDPLKATRAAMIHLRDLYHDFGDWHLAMAAYNCGPGCVNRAIRRTRGTNPDYWEVRLSLPRETRHYVPQYIAAAKLAMNPQKYGVRIDTITFMPEYRFDIFPVDSAVSLAAIAKACNISVQELRELNPELIKSCTPPDIPRYEVKIPYGSKESFAYNFAMLRPEEKSPFLTHTVLSRESVSSIARKYKVSQNELVKLNSLDNSRARLDAGQKLLIPIDPLEWASRVDTGEDEDTADENIYHVVRSGESLFSIAGKYGVSVDHIRNLNNMSSRRSTLHPGQQLLVVKVQDGYGEQKKETKSPQKTSAQKVSNDSEAKKSDDKSSTSKVDGMEVKIIKHRVKRGENLNTIAQKYNTSISNLQSDNDIRGSKIFAGQQLKVRTLVPATESEDPDTSNNQVLVHKVQKGETLHTIAQNYGISISDLKGWNPDTITGNTVYYNTRLKIYRNTGDESSKWYSIQKGDTLSSIARKFGVSVVDLKKINTNINTKRLQVGQKIRVQ